MKRGAWFGLTILAMIAVAVFILMPPISQLTNGHLGLLMLALIVVAIMLGFPTAFTLMGMGVIFTFLAYRSQDPGTATAQTLDLMVQRAYAVMSNDVLISIPLFVFMGYLVERANLIEKLFKSLHLAMARIPGSLAVATIVTCAIFATATGIVGAVVTLMGLLAMPAMLKAGYNVRLSAGAITAGGCLGILIPPSVMLIVYGATAGVSVVTLYAGAFFPGLMLATMYIGYIIIVAKIKPSYAPPLSEADRHVPLPPAAQSIVDSGGSRNAVAGLFSAIKGKRAANVPAATLFGQMLIALLPAIVFAAAMLFTYKSVTTAPEVQDSGSLVEMGSVAQDAGGAAQQAGGLAEPEAAGGLQEPEQAGGLQEPPADGKAEAAAGPAKASKAEAPAAATPEPAKASAAADRVDAPKGYWIALAIGLAALIVFYAIFSFTRLEIFKMLLGSFFPLAILIISVLGAIVFGLATPGEAAAMGSLGGLVLAGAYRRLNMTVLKESVFLTAKTSAMVCWLFVGSSIFSAAFALLGGQEIINSWVLSMDLTPIQFMILAQVIIFLLGWPLEWTEIIVIFMPIFIP
ncbi:TRAP transporter large permease subunit, partial [Herminiimonas sp.]|uniref:TRAP transporter large permease n=1 Tax=Herminiimonas sp. TaxID=1926289 RepID=UPI002718E30A